MMSASLIVPLEIAKVAFFAVYVAATVGVIVGVYWEGEQFPREKQQRGWTLLVRSLAIDTLFTILVFSADGWINAIQRDQIIALDTRLAARTILPDDAKKIRSVLAQFKDQTFEIIPYWNDDESLDLANQLASVLESAGWKIDEPKQFTALLGVVTGVMVYVDKRAPGKTQAAAYELVTALMSAGILAKPATKNLAPTSPVDTKLAINVGIKP